MTDIETAKTNLAGHSICLCRDGECLFGDKRGISPMMDFIADGVELAGYSVADTVVGKAVALLFVKCGIKCVYAKTLSQGGKRALELYGVPCEYDTLTERIINREGTDVCPMEKAVANTFDAEEAYRLLRDTLKLINAKN